MVAEEVVRDSQGNDVRLRPGYYYHWHERNGSLLHNAKLGKGMTMTISVLAEILHNDGFATPYAILNAQPQKEEVWERIRALTYPTRPTRKRALFCFDEEELARRAKDLWFPTENRQLVKVRLTEETNAFRADSRWLDSVEADWAANTDQYWHGRMTEHPLPEVIVNGLVYLPEWQSFKLMWGG